MAELKDKIENVLNEGRMLMLGGQVLLGFAYRTYFENGFGKLPQTAKIVQTASLYLLTATLGLIIWPAPKHQIAMGGEQRARLHAFATRTLDWALFPFAVATGLSLYPVGIALRLPHASTFAFCGAALALFVWYGLSLPRRPANRWQSLNDESQRQEQEHTQSAKDDLANRIKEVLIECRIALPGAQAMLGFQFVNVFTDSFSKLPRSLQWIHFVSLICTLITTILLIAPAAYHRIAYNGEDSEQFCRVASRFLLAGLVFLAPAMTGDIAVVTVVIGGSIETGVLLALLLLLLFYAIWFGQSALSREPESSNTNRA